jgi:hypothetical protein
MLYIPKNKEGNQGGYYGRTKTKNLRCYTWPKNKEE